jgi:hypothetical protein
MTLRAVMAATAWNATRGDHASAVTLRLGGVAVTTFLEMPAGLAGASGVAIRLVVVVGGGVLLGLSTYPEDSSQEQISTVGRYLRTAARSTPQTTLEEGRMKHRDRPPAAPAEHSSASRVD